MNQYTIKVTTLSATLLGSGDGWGSVVDVDVVFDDAGLPAFPARRLKGLLRESAQEVLEMFETAKLKYFCVSDLERLFGKAGSRDGGLLRLNTLRLTDYPQLYDWCRWVLEERDFRSVISQEVFVNALTETREHTAIDVENGTAQEHSLRRFRAIRPRTVLEGAAGLAADDPKGQALLALACLNLRQVGTVRHKGYGTVKCTLYEGEKDLSRKWLAEIREGAG